MTRRLLASASLATVASDTPFATRSKSAAPVSLRNGTTTIFGGFAGQNEIPRVAGQHYAYIVKQLADFKARKRTNDAGNMTSVASTLSDKDIENLAHYLTGL